MEEQKIKQDAYECIGNNIRQIRVSRKVGRTELARMLQLSGINMTSETLMKIENGIHHIHISQLRGIKNALDTTYDELLK